VDAGWVVGSTGRTPIALAGEAVRRASDPAATPARAKMRTLRNGFCMAGVAGHRIG
jgi:hypothetical protein